MLVGALSIDAFVASFAYATSKIKIPFKSALIINVVSTTILGIALFTGSFVSKFIPSVFTTSICFAMLLMLGLTKLFDSTLKALIGPKGSLTRNYEFKVSDFRFFLNVYIENPDGPDQLFFKAPLLIIVKAQNEIDGGLASAKMELMIDALGLGTYFSSFYERAAAMNPKIGEMIGLKEGEKIISCMVIGYPRVEYKRTVPRKEARITRI